MEGDYAVWSIADMLRIYGRRKATNLRDHVYGLLGLVSPEFRQRIQIQYSSSIGVVYTNFTAAHIEHTRRLELLGWYESKKWLSLLKTTEVYVNTTMAQGRSIVHRGSQTFLLRLH